MAITIAVLYQRMCDNNDSRKDKDSRFISAVLYQRMCGCEDSRNQRIAVLYQRMCG